MADLCDYNIHVRGSKKAALMIFSSMACADDKEITYEHGTDEEYILHFNGCCKWNTDAYCDETWNGEEINLDSYDETALRDCEIDQFMFYKLVDKSAMFHCEIEVYSSCMEEGWCAFSHYKEGDTLEDEYMGEDYEDYDEESMDEEFMEEDEEEPEYDESGNLSNKFSF